MFAYDNFKVGEKWNVMKVKELLKQLQDDGWVKKVQKGSHLQLIHPVKTGKVTLPIHGATLIQKV